MAWQQWVHKETKPTAPAEFRTGDEIRVWYRISEQGKERLGQFEGTVIRYRGSGSSKTFTVRRVTFGEGVERVFPVDTKTIARIEVLRRGHPNRSRLYFLRKAVGKTRLTTTEATTADKAPAAAPPSASPGEAQRTADRPETIAAATKNPAESVSPHS